MIDLVEMEKLMGYTVSGVMAVAQRAGLAADIRMLGEAVSRMKTRIEYIHRGHA